MDRSSTEASSRLLGLVLNHPGAVQYCGRSAASAQAPPEADIQTSASARDAIGGISSIRQFTRSRLARGGPRANQLGTAPLGQ